jgi:hypothetical protein
MWGVVAMILPAVIAPLVLTSPVPAAWPARAASSSRPLPLAALAPTRPAVGVYGVAAMDCNGRVADTAVIRALGWGDGTRVDIREQSGLVVVTADRHGVFRLSGSGYLRLPATARHWCGLQPGDRVLLAAEPDQDRLTVYPPALLDGMIAGFRATTSGGDHA